VHVFNSCGKPLPERFQRAVEIRVPAGLPQPCRNAP